MSTIIPRGATQRPGRDTAENDPIIQYTFGFWPECKCIFFLFNPNIKVRIKTLIKRLMSHSISLLLRFKLLIFKQKVKILMPKLY